MKVAISLLSALDNQKDYLEPKIQKSLNDYSETKKQMKSFDSLIDLLNKLNLTEETSFSCIGIWEDERDWCFRSYRERVNGKIHRRSYRALLPSPWM